MNCIASSKSPANTGKGAGSVSHASASPAARSVSFTPLNVGKRIVQPKSGSWTGWSVRFLGCRARRNDAEWSFHSKELQRSHVPQKTYNLSRGGITQRVKVKFLKKSL